MTNISEWLAEWTSEDGPGWDLSFNNRIVEYSLPDLEDALDIVRMRSGVGQPVVVIDAEDNEETLIS